jgi:hypothetical protein
VKQLASQPPWGHAHERYDQTLADFRDTLPPAASGLAAQVFKDPYLFGFLDTADPRREREIEQALRPLFRAEEHRP